MQIQRIQTLFLLVGAVLTLIFCFVPYAVGSVGGIEYGIEVSDNAVLLIFNATITLLLLITIFLYKNLRLQMTMAKIDTALLIGSIATSLIYVYSSEGPLRPAFDGGLLLLLGAVIFTILAYRRMRRDERLLASAYRLR